MESVEDFLREKKEKGLLRTLRPADFRGKGLIHFESRECTDFSSNDYLGLSEHPELKKASMEASDTFGTGSSASRLLSGDMDIHHRLEERVAVFKGKEASLVFNSGYQANVGVISAFCGRGDAVFFDRLSHASIIDGILLSGARLFRFRHNDPEDLERLLKKERHKFKNSLIVTESVFSMDGDKPPLKEIVRLKNRYGSVIMVDEAHATGVFGKTGSGVVEEAGLVSETELIMGTFSKALGSFGAYVACSEVLKSFLVNACRGFIYSTALPPPVIAANLAGINLVEREPFRRNSLLESARYFREGLQRLGFEIRGASQIVPVILGESREAVRVSLELEKRGYWVLPIRPPTVPENEARLRFSLIYHHTKDVLERLLNDINEVVRIQVCR